MDLIFKDEKRQNIFNILQQLHASNITYESVIESNNIAKISFAELIDKVYDLAYERGYDNGCSDTQDSIDFQ